MMTRCDVAVEELCGTLTYCTSGCEANGFHHVLAGAYNRPPDGDALQHDVEYRAGKVPYGRV